MIDTGQAKVCHSFTVIWNKLSLLFTWYDTFIQEWYNETATGVVIKAWRETNPGAKVAVVTKIHPRDFALEKMTKAMQLSRERLKDVPTDKVDIAILNGPGCPKDSCTKAEMAVTWETV